MPRIRTSVATTPFGIWLERQFERFNTYQKKVVLRSGLGQSTIAGYLSGDRNPKKPEMVEKVVHGILPDGTSDEMAAEVLNSGLQAAGFSSLPISPSISLILEISARYEGGDRLESEVVADLGREVEDYAYVRVGRRVRQMQEAK